MANNSKPSVLTYSNGLVKTQQIELNEQGRILNPNYDLERDLL